MGFLKLRRQCGVSHEVRWGNQVLAGAIVSSEFSTGGRSASKPTQVSLAGFSAALLGFWTNGLKSLLAIGWEPLSVPCLSMGQLASW